MPDKFSIISWRQDEYDTRVFTGKLWPINVDGSVSQDI